MSKKTHAYQLVYLKEMKSIFRDKRMMLSLLSPILFMPIVVIILAIAMSGFMSQQTTIGTNDLKNPIITSIQKNNKEAFTFIEITDVTTQIETGEIIAAIVFPNNFTNQLEKVAPTTIQVTYEPTNQASMNIVAALQNNVSATNEALLLHMLDQNNIDPSITSLISIQSISISPTGELEPQKETDSIKTMLSSIIPMIVIVASASGVFSIATELGAGEKEKNSFQVLLTTKADRQQIITGKLLATITFGLISFLAFILSFVIIGIGIIMFAPDILSAIVSLYSPLSIILTLIILILTTGVISCLALIISMSASTYKESQSYLSYLSLVFILPTYLTLFSDIRNIPSWQLHIPLLNHIVILKQILNGIINWPNIIIVLVWTIIYLIATIYLVKKLLKKEKFLFN